MLRHGVAGFATEDVVEPRLGAAFVAQTQKILQGFDDPPACVEVDRNVELVLGWHVGRVAVPFQHPLVDRIDHLDEGQLELESGRRDRGANRFAELGDDHLLDLADGIDGVRRDEGQRRDAQHGQS